MVISTIGKYPITSIQNFLFWTWEIWFLFDIYRWLKPGIFTGYREGRSQRLKREEAKDRNQDKKVIAAESWYLLHILERQKFVELISTSVTLAVEHAAASDRNESTQSPTTMTDITPGWRDGRLKNTEYPSTRANVKLHGTTKPIIVTKKQKEV